MKVKDKINSILESMLELNEEIEVEGVDDYEFTHGHKPRGDGNWAFEIDGSTKFFKGTYTNAKREALSYAKGLKKNIRAIKVLT